MKQLFFTILLFAFSLQMFSQGEFITVWKTDNFGVSESNEIMIPAVGSYKVVWENIDNPSHNGSNTYIVNSVNDFPTLNFGASGMYRLKISSITSSVFGFEFPKSTFGTTDCEKIIRVEQWGSNKWTTTRNMFYNCVNLEITATDNIDLTQVAYMTSMFYCCQTMKGNATISSWNTGNIVDMVSMFSCAEQFNQSLGYWDVSKVSKMDNMLDNTGLSSLNYNATLLGWSSGTILSNVKVGVQNLVYSTEQANQARQVLQGKGWTFIGDRYDPSASIPNKEISSISFYPNPAQYSIIISGIDRSVNIQLYDNNGKKVLDLQAEKDTVIDVSMLPSGIFYIKIGDKKVSKLIKN